MPKRVPAWITQPGPQKDRPLSLTMEPDGARKLAARLIAEADRVAPPQA